LWISGEFHWLKEDPWRYFYNASKLSELVSIEKTLKAYPQTTTTPKAIAIVAEGRNPVQDKGKRKIVEDPEGEKR